MSYRPFNPRTVLHADSWERVWRRARPYVDHTLAAHPRGVELAERIDAGDYLATVVRVGGQYGLRIEVDGLPVCAIAIRNVGLTADGRYRPDPFLDDDLVSLPWE